ncbi:sulfatase domain protein [Cordyceps fumosorosea ARSEF 2679]|uniref:Sulfatase domain protein n=1 Tax=Cordyceps fumosorosea (strain ARSEF 2679) TaxID=1081104 RepID=A0A162MVF5_CORFA|nr:sulfatase domain protein [Cordyceps fumosorosea ARSEF 2679]OAA71159.1 sulfatase domain protein [Cordyceps fumosorosea ARSEF 2679]
MGLLLQQDENNHHHSRASAMAGRRCLAAGRRFVGALGSFFRITDRTFVFSLATTSILASKCLHIYIHSQVLSLGELIQWLPSLFMQDTVIILLLRFLLDAKALGRFGGGWFRFLAMAFSTVVALLQHFLAVSNISFFLMIGGEPRWRNAGLVADSNTWAIMLTGLWAFISANVGLFFGSMLLKSPTFFFAGIALDVVKATFTLILTKIGLCSRARREVEYVPVGKEELYDDLESYPSHPAAHAAAPRRNPKLRLLYIGTTIFLFVQLLTCILQPAEQAFIFLSWTAIAMPIVDYLRGSDSPLTSIFPVYDKSMDQKWNIPFSLAEPTHWDWLPKQGSAPAGFGDWYDSEKKHYDHNMDPISQPNYDKELLDSLKGKLSDVSIRNVMFIFLESTRKDVFPFKKGEYIYNKMRETWDNKKLPEKAEERAATLTQNARFLTGDYSDGFDHKETPRRGGINVNKNTPSATYTLKSLTGGLCGVNPLVADMNREYRHHIYQPCLPHIFKVLNGLNDASNTDGFVNRPFNNSFMMSVTGQYDHQYELMQAIGYLEDEMVDSEYLHSDKAVFGNVTIEDVRYDGMPEPAVEDYFRDALRTSRENDTRLFLTHLTSSTHFPYGLPGDEVYVPMVQDDANNHLQDISKHLNAVGYVDRWVGHLLDIVEEEGATNDTLIVLVGDHGVPVIEMGGASPWGVPSIGSFHVPLVLSHPHLPVIDINELVSSLSIVPTVLDLLLETGALSMGQQKAARDLLHTYEAPSLIRPLQAENRRWYFTSVSPGGQAISTRSMDSPRWRLLVPLIQDTEWYFSDLETDPHEEGQVASFDFVGMLRAVEKKYGADAAKWAEEAAFATRWWVSDNHQRWEYI